MYNFFGKKTGAKKKSKKVSSPAGLPAPDVAGTAFGRYLRYGRRAAFGRQYFGNDYHMMPDGTMMKGPPCKGAMFGRSARFGAQRIPLFGKKKASAPEMPEEGESAFGMYKLPSFMFGRRRYRRKGVRKGRKGRKGGRKGGKPSKALVRMCRKHHIKVTRKVGKRKVYKKVSVLKKQLKRKIRLHRKKSKKTVRRTRRRRSHFSLF
jgi:hypothetical protein